MRVSNIALAIGIVAAALAVPLAIEGATGADLSIAGEAKAVVCGAGYVHETYEGGSRTECGLLYIS